MPLRASSAAFIPASTPRRGRPKLAFLSRRVRPGAPGTPAIACRFIPTGAQRGTRLDQNADSYVCGVADAPLLGDTIGRSLDPAAQRWADREALVSPSHGVRWTWKEFAERVDALAAGFLALGLERGARIGIWSLNRPEWTLTQFAAAKAGLILVTINPAYRLSELEFALAKVGCAAIVTATAFKTSNYMEMLNTLLPELAKPQPGDLHAARLPQLRAVIQVGGPVCPGTIAFEDVTRHGRRAPPRDAGGTGASAAVRRSPSTSSSPAAPPARPRASTLTHHNILNNGYFVGRAMRPDRTGPHLHSGAALSLLRHGDGQPGLPSPSAPTMVYPAEGFDPLAMLQTVEGESCTALYGVPTMFIAELDHPDSRNSTCRRCAPASWPARPARSR